MKVDRENFIPAMVLGALFIGIIVYVQPYPMAAKRLLVLVSVLGLILTSMIMVQAARPKKNKAADAKQDAIARHGGKHSQTVPVKALMEALAWLAGILIMIYLLGFQFGLLIYTCLYARLHGGRWLSSILLGVGVLIFLYLIFHFLLDAVTPPGLLFELYSEYFDH